MKPKNPITVSICACIACIVLFVILFPSHLNAQCATVLKSKTYNVLLNGTGNNSWGFLFPQFDPSVGTLVAVDIKSIVSVNVNFQLQNDGSSADSYSLQVGRDDDISVSSLVSPISNFYSTNNGPYNLQAGQDTVGAGTTASPQFFPLLSSYLINDSIVSDVVGFLGTGYVTFNYNPVTYVTVATGSNYNLSSAASDTMKISLVYYYCTSNILPESITSFSVEKDPGSYAKLSWDVQNEQPGMKYVIEESNDGINFDSVGFVLSSLNKGSADKYIFDYLIPSGTTGKLYFRLREISGEDFIRYSEIRMLDLDNFSGPYLSPNPAQDFVDIVFGESSADHEVQIFAIDGRLIQKNYYINSSSAHISFINKLAKGVYFARVINSSTKSASTILFVIR